LTAYKLEGLDEDWTNAGTRREAYYPYLPPGKYTFRVIAANSDNVWNNEGAAIEITVLPPFYRTFWFIGLAILSFGVVGFALYRRRVSELERRRTAQEEFSRRLINAHETERRRIAAELHDSLGQSLAMIKNSAVFGSQTAEDLPAAKEQLAEISTQSAHAIAEVREIAYNLRPYLLDRLGLTKAIRSLLNKTADAYPIKVISEVDEVDEFFPNEAEISIYRIVQESLNNVIKHSDASEVKVSVEESERAVIIKIEDDGKGFDVNAENNGDNRGGFGLFGMAERVRMLGGTIAIESETGKGTKILIKISPN
jgi:signal transduction histidine kinase